ncbi:hypothetical protein [Streptomyces youssoufiensis]
MVPTPPTERAWGSDAGRGKAWINVPNEEFRTRSGQSFDGPGIPPHLYEPVFTEEEFAHRRDSAFDRSLRVLPGDGGAPGAA